MGRSSKELKELKKKQVEYPALDVDYYVVRVKRGEPIPAGWLNVYSSRNDVTTYQVVDQLAKFKSGVIKTRERDVGTTMWCGYWVLYPGLKPDKRWGPVCP